MMRVNAAPPIAVGGLEGINLSKGAEGAGKAGAFYEQVRVTKRVGLTKRGLRWGLIIQACIIFGFEPFFMAIEAELRGFELAYDIDLSFFWNFAFHI